jgi:hypothetical protein
VVVSIVDIYLSRTGPRRQAPSGSSAQLQNQLDVNLGPGGCLSPDQLNKH